MIGILIIFLGAIVSLILGHRLEKRFEKRKNHE